jgi:hypothetical protein
MQYNQQLYTIYSSYIVIRPAAVVVEAIVVISSPARADLYALCVVAWLLEAVGPPGVAV